MERRREALHDWADCRTKPYTPLPAKGKNTSPRSLVKNSLHPIKNPQVPPNEDHKMPIEGRSWRVLVGCPISVEASFCKPHEACSVWSQNSQGPGSYPQEGYPDVACKWLYI